MKINAKHWLEPVNREPFPGGLPMLVRRFLVIHFTAGASALSSIRYWREMDNGVLAHFVIDRDGTIYQCRPCNRTAGHAGESSWTCPKTGKRFKNLNSCSIGIELANAGDDWELAGKWTALPPFVASHKNGGPQKKWERCPAAQLASCTMLAEVLVDRYNLDDIVGHDDIAPKRKTDPGPAFPMGDLREACGFPKNGG